MNKSYSEVVRPAIVAFVEKYVPIFNEETESPPYPRILGTGFVVHEDGLIATNAHVVRAFSRAFKPSDVPPTEWPVLAFLFHRLPEGVAQIPLEIVGAAVIQKFDGGKFYYGPKNGPDIAFVKVKARKLPSLKIDAVTQLQEGMIVWTAGFPMGTDALVAPGWLHQVTPTLQAGIVSAVLPFVCSTPHAFSINVMTQGGASGSPVFLPDSGQIVGILYGGLVDFDVADDRKTVYRIPTSISYVVPAHYLERSLSELHKSNREAVAAHPDGQTIDEMLKSHTLTNAFEDRSLWRIQRNDPIRKVEDQLALPNRARDDD